jgi:hypothetical protein
MPNGGVVNEIYWDGDRFCCNNPEMEAAHQIKLASKLNSALVCKYMQSCGFDIEIIAVTLSPGRQFPENLEFYPRGLRMSEQGFSLGDMGSGFAICFGLIGYVLASQDFGGSLRVYGGSFRGLLHPNLYSFLSIVFSSKENKVYKKCPYFSGSEYLKCAINPSLPCSECKESPDSFRGRNLEWTEECNRTHKVKSQSDSRRLADLL